MSASAKERGQAVVLVGGLGTRLGALTESTPKPMLEVGGRPFLELLLEEIARHGFGEILLLCGHQAQVIVARYAGKSFRGAVVRCVVEPRPLGTAGALRHALAELCEDFFLFNGDSWFDVNVLDLLTLGAQGPWEAKLALRHVDDAARYGRVETQGEVVQTFAEKGAPGPGWINGGVYHLRRSVIESLEEGPCSLESTVLPRLLSQGTLRGRRYEGYFIDIGIPGDLQRAREELGNRRRRAAFFDRDGVLNEDRGYTYRVEELRWTAGAREAIKAMNDAGWLVFVVTNQAGVARGYYGPQEVVAFHAAMQEALREVGAHVDAFAFCPHHAEGSVAEFAIACACRKPQPGMILDLASSWPVDLDRSLLVGDKQSDVEAARAAGVPGFLFEGGDLRSFLRDVLGDVSAPRR